MTTAAHASLCERAADEELILLLAGSPRAFPLALARTVRREEEPFDSCHSLLEHLANEGLDRSTAFAVAIELGHGRAAIVMTMRFIIGIPLDQIDDCLRSNGLTRVERLQLLTG